MVEIRRVKITDIPSIVALNIRVWQSAYKGIIDQGFLDARINGKEAAIKIQEENFNNSSYVAVEDDVIIGYAAYGKERSGIELTGEIYAIYIDEEMQGKGIGRMLVEKCIEALSVYEYLHIWTLKDNPNKSFYISLGGKEISRKYLTIGNQSLESVCFEYNLSGGKDD